MKAKFKEIAVSDIERDPHQPRTFGDSDVADDNEPGLAELAASIKTHGVMEPVIVRPLDGGRYRLVAGERRWRASKMAKVPTIPALVSTDPAVTQDATRFVIQVEENLQRKSLTPLELGQAAEKLMKDLGITAAEVAQMLHVAPSTVSRWRTALDPAHEEKLAAVNGNVTILETLRGLPRDSQEAVLQLHRKSGRTFSERDIRKVKALDAPVTPKAIVAALDRPPATAPVAPRGKSSAPAPTPAAIGGDDEAGVLAHLRTEAYARQSAAVFGGTLSKTGTRRLTESDMSPLAAPRSFVADPKSIQVSLHIPAARARELLFALGQDGDVSPLELQVRLLEALRGR